MSQDSSERVSTSALRRWGDRYTAFIDRYEVAWELTMAALAVLFVIVGFAEPPPDQVALYDAVDVALTIIFLLEFSTRLAASRNRSWYLRRHWIDAIALIPAARALRLLRLIRLLRLVRAFAGIFRALASIERFAAHRNLLALFGAWLTTAVICGAGLYLAEVGVNENISSFGDALWWAVVTIATVGYGDISPITPEGRAAAAILIIVGITLWAAVTGTITSLLVSGSSATASIPEQIRQLSDLLHEDLISETEFATKKSELLARM